MKNKKKILTLLAALGLGTAAANAFTDMDVADFANYIKQPEVQLVDVRHPEEYAAGHLEGAQLIDVQTDDFIPTAEKALDKERPVAVYCRSGRRSSEAAEELALRGYKVVNLAGGILAWQHAALPVVK